MTWCAAGSSWLVAARTATVLPTPTSPVMTPNNDSAMQKRMRATASWWLARSHNLLAGMVFENGMREKPKCETHGMRVMAAGPPAPLAGGAGPGHGRRSNRSAQRHAWPAAAPGNRRRLLAAPPIGRRGHRPGDLVVHVATKHERHRTAHRSTLP